MINQNEAAKLWELVKPLHTAMLVSLDDSSIRARPMQLVQNEFNGEFYFLTLLHSEKTEEIKYNEEVGLVFSCPKQQVYVSISGTSTISKDQTIIDQIWSSMAEAWFSKDKNDPSVGVIKVVPYQAEYWQTEEFKITQLFNYAKALLTHTKPNIGEHKSLNDGHL